MKNSSFRFSPAEKEYATVALALSWGQGQAKGRGKLWGPGDEGLHPGPLWPPSWAHSSLRDSTSWLL